MINNRDYNIDKNNRDYEFGHNRAVLIGSSTDRTSGNNRYKKGVSVS